MAPGTTLNLREVWLANTAAHLTAGCVSYLVVERADQLLLGHRSPKSAKIAFNFPKGADFLGQSHIANSNISQFAIFITEKFPETVALSTAVESMTSVIRTHLTRVR